MRTNRTNEQNRAIDSRGTNLLVSAAAGAGKTTVLIDRIMDLILQEHISVDRMLIVTFTNDAAAQMRQRLQRALSDALEKCGPSDEAYLNGQMDLLARADISTMHRFCIRVLQQYYMLAGLPAAFRVGDEQTIWQLREDAAREVIEEKYALGLRDFTELTEYFSRTTGDAELIEMLLGVYDKTRNQVNPRGWLHEAVKAYAQWKPADLSHPWNRQILRVLKARYTETMERARMLLRSMPDDEDYYGIPEALGWDIDACEERIGLIGSDPERFMQTVTPYSPQRMPSKRGADKAKRDAMSKKRTAIRKKIIETDELAAEQFSDQKTEEMQTASRLVREIAGTVDEIDAKIYEEMVRRGILDFSALEHCAIAALENGADAALRERYEAIFFDEYQDANRVQEHIIQKIMRDTNRFLVGDVKQSIYGFRAADPGMFLEKSKDWGEGKGGERIDLVHNFRSRETILKAVNSVFYRIMEDGPFSVKYDAHAALVPGRDVQKGGCPVWLHILNKELDEEDEEDDVLSFMRASEREAKYVASLVRDLLRTGRLKEGDGEERPVRKGDIAILVRSASNSAEDLSYALEQEGIECLAQMSTHHFDTVEVRAILCVLSVLDNPYQDVELIAVLRSPFFLFDLNELAAIRVAYPKVTFYEALCAYAKEQNDPLAGRCASALDTITSWRLRSRVMTVQQTVEHIMAESGYEDMLLASPLGRQKHANIRLLLSRIAGTLDGTLDGIPEFLAFVKRLRRDEKDMEEASLEEDADAVRIMTVHRSKGLEFPVVILPMLGKPFNKSGNQKRVLLDSQLHIGFKLNDNAFQTMQNPASLAVSSILQEKGLMEEQRVLYVAMTRARERLIMTGTVKGGLEACGNEEVHTAGCLLDWVVPAALAETEKAHRDGTPAVWEIAAAKAESGLLPFKEDAQDVQEHEDRETETLREIFEWTYPYSDETKVLTKTTVSRLKQRRSPQADEQLDEQLEVVIPLPKRPEYYGSNTGARKGTATHAAVQHLDFGDAADLAHVKAQIDGMVEREILSKEDRDLIDDGKILILAESGLGRRFREKQKKGSLMRETPFTLSDEHGMLIQGVIDAWFEEEDGIVLVDFKTDALGDKGLSSLTEKYAVQLDWYARALEKLTGKKVKERIIYSFSADELLYLRRPES
ncbi:MAG: UvrD-helicase domain-containing protein [Clostridia bacterium]|nr:UvrD-helicase domain-containing protein [Clostridia bacterium]